MALKDGFKVNGELLYYEAKLFKILESLLIEQ
jgi:hypothetical protein